MTTNLDYAARRISQILENILSNREFIRVMHQEYSILSDEDQRFVELCGRQLCEMEVEYATLTGTPVVHHTAIVPV